MLLRKTREKDPIKILFLNRSFFPDQAATGQLLTELCEDLANEFGLEVTVIAGPALYPSHKNAEDENVTSDSGFYIVKREEYKNIKILRAYSTRFDRARSWRRFTNYLSYLASSFFAGFYACRPDIIVSLTDPPIVGLIALFWRKVYRSKYVYLCQDMFPEVANLLQDFRSNRLNSALDKLNRFLLQSADAVVAIGETMKRRLCEEKGVPDDKVVVIHNWSSIDGFNLPDKSSNPFARKYQLTDKFVVMHSGNLGLSQNLEIAIETARLLRNYPDIFFVIIGDGVKKKALMDQAKTYRLDNVLFLPYQPKESLGLSLSTADVFIVSLKKGLSGYIVPSKVYGILASGRPYVAAVEQDCEAAAIARKFQCGLLAEPDDVEDVAEKVLVFYRNRDLCSRMGENARQAARVFDRKVAVKSYYSLFTGLLENSASKLTASDAAK